jgi:hypothetical protein
MSNYARIMWKNQVGNRVIEIFQAPDIKKMHKPIKNVFDHVSRY